MAREPTVQANSLLKVVAAAGEAGLDVDGLLDAVHLGRAALAEPDARVPLRALIALYELAATRAGDPVFGLRVGARSHPRMFDVLGYAAVAEATLGHAFGVVDRFLRVLQEGAEVRLGRRGDRAHVSYAITASTVAPGRHETEATMAILVRFIEAATGRRFRPDEVELAHPAPADTAEHRRVFGVTPRFGAGRNRLHFGHAWLDAPLVAADPGLVRVLERHLTALAELLPAETSEVAPVRDSIARLLRGGPPSIGAVASAMALSERTLQRRLRQHGVTFTALVEEVRRDLATRYLGEARLSIGEVGFLLGYADTAGFYRAFRRWTGTTPVVYRRGLPATGALSGPAT
jgi:AraC-like DNA-binding protein